MASTYWIHGKVFAKPEANSGSLDYRIVSVLIACGSRVLSSRDKYQDKI